MIRLMSENYKNKDVIKKLTAELIKIMDDDTVIVNIGTDRNIGDSVAPLVGTILESNKFKLPVYGTIKTPIHALNIGKELQKIKTKHPNARMIGIDSCLGDKEEIGSVILRDSPIHPGAGVGKSLPEVGTYSIISIVGDSENNDLFSSNNIRLDFVMDISKVIAKSLINAERIHRNEKKEIAICNL